LPAFIFGSILGIESLATLIWLALKPDERSGVGERDILSKPLPF
jgi:hypothetical protein